jgi:hypothetical protein
MTAIYTTTVLIPVPLRRPGGHHRGHQRAPSHSEQLLGADGLLDYTALAFSHDHAHILSRAVRHIWRGLLHPGCSVGRWRVTELLLLLLLILCVEVAVEYNWLLR